MDSSSPASLNAEWDFKALSQNNDNYSFSPNLDSSQNSIVKSADNVAFNNFKINRNIGECRKQHDTANVSKDAFNSTELKFDSAKNNLKLANFNRA